MKNIAIIANFAPNFKGNFIASLLNLDNRLAKENIRIVYFFPESAGKFAWLKELRESGRIVHAFSKNEKETASILLSAIKSYNIGILHTHFWWTNSVIARIKVATYGKLKIIRHFHNTASGLSPIASNNLLGRMKQKVSRMRHSLSGFLADLNCGCGKAVYDDLLLYYKKSKCCYVENKIDFSRFDVPCNESKDKHGLADNVVCMIFGNHFHRKGCDIAIKALLPIESKYRIKLLIVCATQSHEEITSKIIETTGSRQNWIELFPTTENIGGYYKISDIFLAPSREEGFAYAIPEALYCDCPVIRSDLPAMDRGLPHDLIVPGENAEALREKIEYVIENMATENFKHLLSEQKQYVFKNFSIDSWSEEIFAMYKRFL